MKKLLFILVAGLIVLSCNQSPTQNNDKSGQLTATMDSVRDGVFIHIKEGYNDPHKVLMPLKMATLMADDKDVIVYMDIDAVELLAKNAKDLTFMEFESAHTYLKQLTGKGISVYACPTCLKVAGINPEDLMEGIQLAQKDKFFDFTKGRILALDY